MSYISPLYPSEFVIDESNVHIYAPDADVEINGEKFTRGREVPALKERSAAPWKKAYDGPVYTREVIRDIIKEREQRGFKLSDIVRKKQVPTSNQNSTNFCWTYGVVSALNVMRVFRNMPYVEFSRESVAAPIKGYKNQGGWGDQALEYLVDVGIMPQSVWPKHHYSSAKYNTPENLLIAAQYKVLEFLVVPDNNFLAQASALLHYGAMGVGYNWWSHEVCAVDPVIIGATDLGFRIWNSWTDSYGDKGFAVLSESKAEADDCVIPIVQMGE